MGSEQSSVPAKPAASANSDAPKSTTESDSTSSTRQGFDELGVSAAVRKNLAAMGFSLPTVVQAAAIPPALAGEDLLVQSRTGSGKTAAFGIPLCQRLAAAAEAAGDGERSLALVLAPTRELAQQVAAECERIAAGLSVGVVPIYGGAAIAPQVEALKSGSLLVAGTPGRVLDHIRRGTLASESIRMLVLDECDQMLSMGFLEEIHAIIEALPIERQSLLFSATIPKEIERIAQRYMRDPQPISLSGDYVAATEVSHHYYLITEGDRLEVLLQVLRLEKPDSALVFCNTRDYTARVAKFLREHDFAAEAISSDLSQKDRERVLAKMHQGQARFLVATDVAARGIDISELSHVINFDFPNSVDVYVHRTGRTGRAGRSGVAISLVSPQEVGTFYYLKLIHKIYPQERHLPTAQEIATREEGHQLAQLRAAFVNRPRW